MKNYILTFTNNAISQDVSLQEKALVSSLGEDTYVSKLNEEITFEAIDREVETALANNFNNFICLAESEDVDMLQEGLEAEYGDRFNEILVIPEAFGRLIEDTPTMQVQPTTSSQPNNTLVSEKVFNDIKSLIVSEANRNGPVIDLSLLATNIKAFTNAVKYTALALSTGIRGFNPNTKITFDKTNKSITYSDISFLGTIKPTPIETLSYETFINKYSKAAIEASFTKNARYNAITVNISMKGEKEVSQSTNLLVYLVSTSYPFSDSIIEMCKDIQATISNYKQFGIDVRYMICGPLQGQQYLPSASLLELAKKLPEAELENILASAGIAEGKLLHCGSAIETNIVASLQAITAVAPKVKNIWVRCPQGIGATNFKILKSNSILKCINGTSAKIVEVTEGTLQFTPARNQPIYTALADLVKNKDNEFKNAKSKYTQNINKIKIENEKSQAAEVANLDPSERASRLKAMKKQLSKNPLNAEIQTGWPAFIMALVEATVLYQKQPQEKNMSPQEFNQTAKGILDTILKPVYADINAWYETFKNTGFDIFTDAAIGIYKTLKKDNPKKETPETKKLKALITTDAYKIIKEAFGGKINLDDFIEAEEAAMEAAVLENNEALRDFEK